MNDDASPPAGARRSAPTRGAVRRCPLCGEPTVQAYRPFCSKRCADIDLGRWMKGAYAVPANETDAPDPDDLAVEPNRPDD